MQKSQDFNDTDMPILDQKLVEICHAKLFREYRFPRRTITYLLHRPLALGLFIGQFVVLKRGKSKESVSIP